MDRLQNLREIIGWLKRDDPRFAGVEVPASVGECARLMRALLNVREPRAVDAHFLEMQDAELRAQLEERGAVEPHGAGISLWQGDITRLRVDAIVNAANSQMLGCFIPLHSCIDNAIHSAAGVQLRLECGDMMRRLGREARTGEALITRGYNLPARYVIHTVGPIVTGNAPTAEQERELSLCYSRSLDLAAERGLRSVAFCCISTGVFRFPHRRAAEIAVGAVRKWMAAHDGQTSVDNVLFNVFKDEDRGIYEEVLSNERF